MENNWNFTAGPYRRHESAEATRFDDYFGPARNEFFTGAKGILVRPGTNRFYTQTKEGKQDYKKRPHSLDLRILGSTAQEDSSKITINDLSVPTTLSADARRGRFDFKKTATSINLKSELKTFAGTVFLNDTPAPAPIHVNTPPSTKSRNAQVQNYLEKGLVPTRLDLIPGPTILKVAPGPTVLDINPEPTLLDFIPGPTMVEDTPGPTMLKDVPGPTFTAIKPKKNDKKLSDLATKQKLKNMLSRSLYSDVPTMLELAPGPTMLDVLALDNLDESLVANEDVGALSNKFSKLVPTLLESAPGPTVLDDVSENIDCSQLSLLVSPTRSSKVNKFIESVQRPIGLEDIQESDLGVVSLQSSPILNALSSKFITFMPTFLESAPGPTILEDPEEPSDTTLSLPTSPVMNGKSSNLKLMPTFLAFAPGPTILDEVPHHEKEETFAVSNVMSPTKREPLLPTVLDSSSSTTIQNDRHDSISASSADFNKMTMNRIKRVPTFLEFAPGPTQLDTEPGPTKDRSQASESLEVSKCPDNVSAYSSMEPRCRTRQSFTARQNKFEPKAKGTDSVDPRGAEVSPVSKRVTLTPFQYSDVKQLNRGLKSESEKPKNKMVTDRGDDFRSPKTPIKPTVLDTKADSRINDTSASLDLKTRSGLRRRDLRSEPTRNNLKSAVNKDDLSSYERGRLSRDEARSISQVSSIDTVVDPNGFESTNEQSRQLVSFAKKSPVNAIVKSGPAPRITKFQSQSNRGQSGANNESNKTVGAPQQSVSPNRGDGRPSSSPLRFDAIPPSPFHRADSKLESPFRGSSPYRIERDRKEEPARSSAAARPGYVPSPGHRDISPYADTIRINLRRSPSNRGETQRETSPNYVVAKPGFQSQSVDGAAKLTPDVVYIKPNTANRDLNLVPSSVPNNASNKTSPSRPTRIVVTSSPSRLKLKSSKPSKTPSKQFVGSYRSKNDTALKRPARTPKPETSKNSTTAKISTRSETKESTPNRRAIKSGPTNIDSILGTREFGFVSTGESSETLTVRDNTRSKLTWERIKSVPAKKEIRSMTPRQESKKSPIREENRDTMKTLFTRQSTKESIIEFPKRLTTRENTRDSFRRYPKYVPTREDTRESNLDNTTSISTKDESRESKIDYRKAVPTMEDARDSNIDYSISLPTRVDATEPFEGYGNSTSIRDDARDSIKDYSKSSVRGDARELIKDYSKASKENSRDSIPDYTNRMRCRENTKELIKNNNKSMPTKEIDKESLIDYNVSLPTREDAGEFNSDYKKSLPSRQNPRETFEDYSKSLPTREDASDSNKEYNKPLLRQNTRDTVKDISKSLPTKEDPRESNIDYKKSLPTRQNTFKDYSKSFPAREEARESNIEYNQSMPSRQNTREFKDFTKPLSTKVDIRESISEDKSMPTSENTKASIIDYKKTLPTGENTKESLTDLSNSVPSKQDDVKQIKRDYKKYVPTRENTRESIRDYRKYVPTRENTRESIKDYKPVLTKETTRPQSAKEDTDAPFKSLRSINHGVRKSEPVKRDQKIHRFTAESLRSENRWRATRSDHHKPGHFKFDSRPHKPNVRSDKTEAKSYLAHPVISSRQAGFDNKQSQSMFDAPIKQQEKSKLAFLKINSIPTKHYNRSQPAIPGDTMSHNKAAMFERKPESNKVDAAPSTITDMSTDLSKSDNKHNNSIHDVSDPIKIDTSKILEIKPEPGIFEPTHSNPMPEPRKQEPTHVDSKSESKKHDDKAEQPKAEPAKPNIKSKSTIQLLLSVPLKYLDQSSSEPPKTDVKQESPRVKMESPKDLKSDSPAGDHSSGHELESESSLSLIATSSL